MRKTKLLFIMESLGIGGAEKSLLTLLSKLDYDRFDVSLFLFRHNGELMQFLPAEVNLLPEDTSFAVFANNRKTAPLAYLRRGDFVRAWYSFCYLIGCVWQRLTNKPLYIGWHFVRRLFGDNGLSADIAIAYLERKCVYFTAEKVSAPCKIAFVHNDYSVYPHDAKLDTCYFADYRTIATVSNHCRHVLAELFPQYAERFAVVRNTVSSSMIRRMAQEQLPQALDNDGALTLVTVGRLVEQKGYDRAIKICRMLVDKGLLVRWFAVGGGPARSALEEQVDRLGLRQNFVFVGATANPYPWMNAADVYVQPSRFEGFGITVAEAKALGKRIVCSDIPEFREQLEDYPNAWLAASEEEFSRAIEVAAKVPLQACETAEDSIDAFYRCLER
ncbi:glycosyltransferase [Olsenella sp. An285]|uniref:glycosyltransferase n=1 Tax=Olsenella sp. An285 TaxID=1965621 RepID=UPI001302930C|nr:glycosyltransferase [Olsenella sp. An285]